MIDEPRSSHPFRLRLAGAVLRASGVMLLLLGVVHLIATPHMGALLDGLPPKARAFALGPTILNHVLVGILLLPLGLTAIVAAADDHIREPWARTLLAGYALAMLSLPVAILVLMRNPAYFHAPLFLAGVTITAVIAVLVVAAAWIAVFGNTPTP